MDAVTAIHNAARRYCTDRIQTWQQAYADLCSRGGNCITKGTGEWTYTDAARDIFPRYNVLGAILHDVETLVPGEYRSTRQLREMLGMAGATARNAFCDKSDHEIERQAIEEERRAFCAFIQSADEERWRQEPLLPFRRVLSEAEHRKAYAAFVARWGNWYGGYVDREDLPPNVTLHTDVMEQTGAYDLVREALRGRGIERLLELREWGDGLELEAAIAGFAYTGAEGFWTAGDMDWMITASHEASITFGGDWLVQWMRERLPQFQRYLYKGWDSGAY